MFFRMKSIRVALSKAAAVPGVQRSMPTANQTGQGDPPGGYIVLSNPNRRDVEGRGVKF
jgi:hypothetical protein